MTRREWVFAGVATGSLLLAAVVTFSSVSLAALTPNPAYSPIFAAMITAPTIAFGAWIAYRALRLNHDSQLSPNRLELYKRQIDLFGDICRKAQRVHRLAWVLGDMVEAPLAERIRAHARLSRARNSLSSTLSRNSLIIPSDINKLATELFVTAIALSTMMQKEKPDAERVIECGFRLLECTSKVLRACGEIIAPDHLSDGWREMIETHRQHIVRRKKQREQASAANPDEE